MLSLALTNTTRPPASSWVPPVLERPLVRAAAVVLYVGQFVVGTVSVLDSAWDVVHTAQRPVIGGAIEGRHGQHAHTSPAIVVAALCGRSALASHVVKAGTRVGVNASPEPFSNIIATPARGPGRREAS